MTNPFVSLNGDTLSDADLARRQRMLSEILQRYETTDCCRKVPDWREQLHRMNYCDLGKRYHLLFGRDCD